MTRRRRRGRSGGAGGRAPAGFAWRLAAGVACAACTAPEKETAAFYPTPVRGMIVSEHPLATEVGTAVLARGGNAADAAVAAALVLTVVHPRAASLGGGGLALWTAHAPDEDPLVLDFRVGGAGAPIPGVPHGLWALHDRLGRVAFRDLALPAIELARGGFEVDGRLARELESAWEAGRLDGESAQVLLPRGLPPAPGDRIVQDELGRTLELLVTVGPDGVYGGRVADALIGAERAPGERLAASDLAAYAPTWSAPVRGWFRGLELLTAAPPASNGFVLIQALSLLDGFPLDEEIQRARADAEQMGRPDASGGLSGRALHWWIEAQRRTFADLGARGVRLADVAELDELLSPASVAAHRVAIGEHANPNLAAGTVVEPDGRTSTEVAVLDGEGNALCLALTLGRPFGSGRFVPRTGILRADGAARSRRPCLATAVVRENGSAVRWVLGLGGTPRGLAAGLEVFLRTEVHGQSPLASVAAPRLAPAASPTTTALEPGWDPLLLRALESRGHVLLPDDAPETAVQVIRVPVGGEPEGASDPRRGGTVGAVGREPTEAARP